MKCRQSCVGLVWATWVFDQPERVWEQTVRSQLRFIGVSMQGTSFNNVKSLWFIIEMEMKVLYY